MPDRRGISDRSDKYSSAMQSALKTLLPTTSPTDVKPATKYYKLLQRINGTSSIDPATRSQHLGGEEGYQTSSISEFP